MKRKRGCLIIQTEDVSVYNDELFSCPSSSKKIGGWAFQCSLKNYENTIEEFFKIVPYFIQEIEHAEVFYEEWRYSSKFELIDGKMVETDYKFIEYNNSKKG